MTVNQHGRLLPRILSNLAPDLFSHPLWAYCDEADAVSRRNIIHRLKTALAQLEHQGDEGAACQILLGLAAMEVRCGDLDAALASVEEALKKAQHWNLSRDSCSSYWAASALHARKGNFHTSSDYLDLLQSSLRSRNQWVTANVVVLIRLAVLDLAQQTRRPDRLAERARRRVSLVEPALEVLLSWGDSSSFEHPLIKEDRSVQPSRHPRSELIPVQKFLGRAGHAVWQAITGLFADEQRLGTEGTGEDRIPAPQAQSDRIPLTIHPIEPFAEDQLAAGDAAAHAERPVRSDPSPSKRPVRGSGILVTSGTGPLMAIHCLGPFRVALENQWVENWKSLRGQAILKYLVNQQGSIAPKDILEEMLWPNAEPESARRNLHQAIYSLRQTLNNVFPNTNYIEFINDGYRLNPAIDLWLDCAAFERHVLEGHRFEKHHQLKEAIAQYGIGEGLYKGSYMADELYEEWPKPRREYLWRMYLDIVIRLCKYYVEHQEYSTTIALSQRILDQDKCQEAAHKFLILCYLAQGQRQLAHSQYQLCAQILDKELELQPSPEIQALYDQITG